MTQVELAKQLGLASYTHVTKLEAGQRAPSLELVIRIAHVFRVTTDYLLQDTIPLEEASEAVAQRRIEQETVPQAFGAKLRTLRLQSKLSQTELRKRLGLASRAYISNLESGRKVPSPELVVQLANFFRVTADTLLHDRATVRDTREHIE